MRLRKSALWVWGLTLAYLAVIASGAKTFTVWSQITDLATADPVTVFAAGNIHAIRYSVMYPVVWLADAVGLPADRVFSFVLVAVFFLLAMVVSKVLSIVKTGSTGRWRTYFPEFFAFFALVSMVMNGRIALAMLGLSTIMLAQVKWQTGIERSVGALAGYTLLGIVLSGVSTGTFLVAMFIAAVFTMVVPLARWPVIRRGDLTLFAIGGLITAAVSPIILMSAEKNLAFYGGGFEGLLRMLSHGAGAFLPRDMAMLGLVGLLLALLCGAYLRRARRLFTRQAPTGPIEGVALSVVLLGPFGYSTMLACLPAIAILARSQLPAIVARMPAPRPPLGETPAA